MIGNKLENSIPLKIAFITIGCRANQADTARMISSINFPFEIVDISDEICDLAVVNTCSVTSRADADGRKLTRRIKRKFPDAKVIITGCSAQINPTEWILMPEVDLVLGVAARDSLSSIILNLPSERSVMVEKPSGGVMYETPAEGHRSRPFLKIQDGCSRGCSYCIVPHARGAERSRPPDLIIRDIEKLASLGFGEIVLTGVHLGRWGLDLQSDFPELIDLLSGIRSEVRLRLSSIEPMDLDPPLIKKILTNPLICPHLHIPLQSGDDNILLKMGREHTASDYFKLVETALETRPDMSLGTDILTGFPGEDEKAFGNTVDIVSKLPFSYLHVFSWSPRQGTRAARMKDRPDGARVSERMKILKGIDQQKRKSFLESNHGKVRQFIIEIPGYSSPEILALSDNYIRVSTVFDIVTIPKGKFVDLAIDTNRVSESGKPMGYPTDLHK